MNIMTYPQIERLSSLSESQFSRKYKAACKPVVLTAAVNWPAASWSFESFRSRYGATEITCSHYDGEWYRGENTKTMPLAKFVCGALSLDWQEFPYYIRDYYALFEHHPELLSDCPIPKYFFDWFSYLPSFMRRPGPRLFMGCVGAVTPLHSDIWDTHAWMTQIAGRKRWILISPDEARYLGPLVNRPGGLPRYGIDPANPDFDRIPEFRQAHPVEAIIAPGETIFVPSGWLHHVVSLDPTISLTGNFMGPGCIGHVLPRAINDLIVKRILPR